MRRTKSKMAGSDHRRYPRKAIKPGYASLSVTTGEHTFDGHIYDISMGGIRFELDDAMDAGTPVEVEMHLPTGNVEAKPIHAHGKVVRFHDPDEVGPIRMGLAFTGLPTAADRRALAGFLSRRESSAAVA
jgi:c-di-GMP-binding flagellar brake protein YcgR